MTATDTHTLTNRGLIDGGEVALDAVTLNNLGTGRIYGDHLSIGATTLTNSAENGSAPVIAARNRLDLGVTTLNNQEHATLLSTGDLVIGGALDSNRQATGQAGQINNASATIEALGNAAIGASQLNNTNQHFSTQSVVLSQTQITEYQLPGHSTRWLPGQARVTQDHNESTKSLSTPEGSSSDGKFYEYDYTRTVSEDRVATSDPGQILAGGSLQLTADSVLNDKSQIIAGSTLVGAIGTLTNTTVDGQHVVRDSGQSIYYWYHHHHGGKRSQGANYSGYNPAPTITGVDLTPTLYEANTASAATSVQVSPISANPVLQASATDGSQVRTTTPNTWVPNSSLYTVNPSSNAHSYVETDPRFANYRTWVTSDYMLTRLGVNPDTAVKRLGDGFYEQKLVADQVRQLSGKSLLAGYSNTEQEYQALMASGVSYGDTWHLTPGVALTAEQMAQLTSDMAGVGSESGSASSTTQAAISGIAGNKNARTGDKETGIGKIFDAKKVEDSLDAQVQITQIFGQLAPKVIAEYAEVQASKYKTLAQNAELLGKSDEAEGYRSEAAKWGEGGLYRGMLHTAIGGLAGGVSGAVGAGTAAAAAPLLSNLQDRVATGLENQGISSEVAQALGQLMATGTATALGAIASKSDAGGAMAFDIDANNRQLHIQEENALKVSAKKIVADRYAGESLDSDHRKALEQYWYDQLEAEALAKVDKKGSEIRTQQLAELADAAASGDRLGANKYLSDAHYARDIVSGLSGAEILGKDGNPIVADGNILRAFESSRSQYKDSDLFLTQNSQILKNEFGSLAAAKNASAQETAQKNFFEIMKLQARTDSLVQAYKTPSEGVEAVAPEAILITPMKFSGGGLKAAAEKIIEEIPLVTLDEVIVFAKRIPENIAEAVESLGAKGGVNLASVEVDVAKATKGTPEYGLLNDPPPNTQVKLSNGTEFKTNQGGYVDEITYSPSLSPGVRDSRQTAVGKEGLPTDVGGHVQGCQFGGTCDRFNLFPQDSNFNNSAYKRWENEIKGALNNGDQVGSVTVHFNRTDPTLARPDSLVIDYSINGVPKQRFFENKAGQ